MLPEATCTTYRQIIRTRLKRWWGHPQFADIEGEAILAGCQTLARLPETDRERAHGLVWWSAWEGPWHFLRRVPVPMEAFT
jgi:hypothetical protein